MVIDDFFLLLLLIFFFFLSFGNLFNLCQIPVSGVAVDNELDIAVDFTVPKLPGRYISYWRMASPSGQKFGQRIWVHIQVIDCNNRY